MRRACALLLAAAAVVACMSLGASSAAAAPGDIGFQGRSYAPFTGSPTGSKPESKLWFNDGRWWASMFDPAVGSNMIFRLDRSTQTWISTGTALDERDSSRADVLWDGATGKLYVASHIFVTSGAATTLSGAWGRLYRYSYHAASDTYTRDLGYPVTINQAQTETLVIDRDSTGTLWATWTQDHRVYVNHTVGGDDATWGTPYIVPGAGTALDNDDISSLVRFGGRIGVMWGNQADDRSYFAVHADGAGDGAWTTEVVPTGFSADDHLNLKADAAGRVYAAIKTSEDPPLNPLILLMVRASGGGWSAHPFGLVADSQTRPIVELDEQHGVLHMLATCPQPPQGSGQSGGDICHKSAPMSSPSFGPGIGEAVIRDAGSPHMNDASSTKQSLGSATGLVVLANTTATATYWHADISLGTDLPAPPPPGGQPPGSSPGGGVLGVTLPRLTLHAHRLRRHRVRLAGSVRPAGSITRVSLQRRNRRGRWAFVRRARLRPVSDGSGRFAFVVRRGRSRGVYRVAIAVPAGSSRSSPTVLVARRPRVSWPTPRVA